MTDQKKKRIRKVRKPTPSHPIHEDSASDPLLPAPDPRFMKIREYKKETDPHEEWLLIKEWLEIAPEGVQEIRKALQLASDIEVRAKELHEESLVAKGNFDDQFRDRSQIWRKEALQYWEEEKKEGLHKQITESMIEDRIIEEHSELYLELKKRKREIKSIAESMSAIFKNVINKRTDLRKLLESETRRPGALPGWTDGKRPSNG